MIVIDRVLRTLEGEPKVIAWACSDGGQTVRLTLSFRGCDDDAFEIDADLLSAKFWWPEVAA